jgi:hypothetical protein
VERDEPPAVEVKSLEAGEVWNVEEEAAGVGRSGGSVGGDPPTPPPPLAPLI